MDSLQILLRFASLNKKKKFYTIQIFWIINSFIQSINIYVYGYFLLILGKEFGELDKNFNILETDFDLLNHLSLISFNNLVILIIFFAIFSNLINYYLIKYSNNFFCRMGENIQYLLLKKYVNMDYQEFLNLRMDKKSSSILMDSQKLYSLLMSFGILLFNVLNLVIIFSILIFINFEITLFAFLSLVIMYLIFARRTKKKLNFNSNIFSTLGTEKINLINTCLNGFRELKIYNLEFFNLEKFKKLTSKVASSKASTVTLSIAPRYFIESFFFLSIGFVIFLIINIDLIEKSLFSYLLILIVSFSRLIPSFQFLYTFFSLVQDGSVSISRINKELTSINKTENVDIKKNDDKNSFKLKPSSIKFNEIDFKFLNNKKIINNFTCEIKSGDKIFISGNTGIGKSTFLDIVAGLLKVSNGKIIINNKTELETLNKVFRQSYVSQFPYLYNSSIIQNISLKDKIDHKEFELIKKLISSLYLEDVVKKDEDLQKFIGDFGNKLSGGQKQRICLARALFVKPDILILDESLNAVDKEKRKKVLNNIININKDQIFLYVSHDQNDLINFKKHLLFKKDEITLMDL